MASHDGAARNKQKIITHEAHQCLGRITKTTTDMTLNTKLAKALAKAVAAIAMVLTTASCTDNIAFGNDFLDKAPSNSTTKDSVFSKAEYAEQFLTGVYSLQYYGIPYRSSSSAPLSASYWQGKFDALTDIYHLHFPSS